MSHCHVVLLVLVQLVTWHRFWWLTTNVGSQWVMWAVDGRCGWLTIDVGGSGHGDRGDGQWWPGVMVDAGLRKREEVCVCVRL